MSAASSKARRDRSGDTIAGKYHLERLLGAGSMGAVYAAVHHFTQKHVALKLIDAAFGLREDFAARFLREARVASEIAHPVICDVLDAGQEPNGDLYLALELLEGRTLDDAIEARDLRLKEIVEVGIQICGGLAVAHDRGIVHRDVKPENIFLTWNAEGELKVKLLDFGVAKHTRRASDLYSTQQGAIFGTPYYMAPEQAAADPVDSRADLWSVGAVLYHAISGRPPHDEDTYNRLVAKLLTVRPAPIREVRPEVPEWLATVVDGALELDVDIRWQSARTMAEALRLRGAGTLDLDWEVHEDQTVRTEAVHDPGEDSPPALAVAADLAPSTIEVDVALFESSTSISEATPTDGRTIRTIPPDPSDLEALGVEKKRATISPRLLLVVGLGVTALLAGVAYTLLFG